MKRRTVEYPLSTTIRARGRITLPKKARERLSLAEGDALLLAVGQTSLEIVPAELVTRDQLWSLTRSVRDRIEAAEEDLRGGRTVVVAKASTLNRAMRDLAGDNA